MQLDRQDVKAYGQMLALKAGLTLDADALQERRKVWEWALEPVPRPHVKVLNADLNKARAGGREQGGVGSAKAERVFG